MYFVSSLSQHSRRSLRVKSFYCSVYKTFIAMMLNYLYFLIVDFYENYFIEFVISVDCYDIYLLLFCQKHNNKFYFHYHPHSKIFSLLLLSIFYLVEIFSISPILNTFCPLTFHFNRLKHMNINPLNYFFKTLLMIYNTPLKFLFFGFFNGDSFNQCFRKKCNVWLINTMDFILL